MSNRTKGHRNTYHTGLCTQASRYPHVHLGIYLPSNFSKRLVPLYQQQRVSLIVGMFMRAYLTHACLLSPISLARSHSLTLISDPSLNLAFSSSLSLCGAGRLRRACNNLHQLWSALIFLASDVPSILLSLRHPHYYLP